MSKIRTGTFVCLPWAALLWIGCQADFAEEEYKTLSQDIWNGTDAVKGSYPWIAEISNASGAGYHHNCDGSLISPDWVLTAAHCIYDGSAFLANDTFRVTLGEHSLSNLDGDEQVARQGLTRTVAQIIPHPQYLTDTGYDLALMRLSQPVTLNQHVQVVRLARGDDGPNANTQFAGWGIALGGDPLGLYEPDILQEANLPIVANSACDDFFQSTGSPAYHDVSAGELCAGHSGTPNTCNADSGGPLTAVRSNGCEEQLGLLSWGYVGCGGYSVYTRVSKHYDWIKQNVSNLAGDLSYEAESMNHPTGNAYSDGWNISSNGYISFTRSFSGAAETMVVRAAGQDGGGWPNMRVTVRNQEVLNTQVTSADWTEFKVQLTPAAGPAEVRIYFTNDNFQPTANPPLDRNLLLDKVTFLGKTACTAASGNLQGTLDVYDDWGAGYCARVQLKNTGATTTTSWSVVVDTGNSTVTQSWNPINMTGSGNHTFSSASWNAAIAPSATYNQSGFCATRAPGSSTRPAIGAITVTY
ncbi:MAG: chymotrypsin like elastase 1, 1 homeolog precursor [Pseudomonadota bacterium]|jgi:secreted trypsin-like serine protease